MADLTPKQQRFVDEYLIDLNATQAALRAGYSARTAEKIGSENLRKPEVKAAIDRAQSNRAEQTQINAAWVLTRLAAEATADVADLYDDDGNILPVKEWPLIWRQGLVAGIETETLRPRGSKGTGQWRGKSQDVHDEEEAEEETVVTKIKLSDRVRRLELIGKHIGVNAFQEVVQHKGLDGLADRMARAAKRNGE
jgi:phage terminase small subunit